MSPDFTFTLIVVFWPPLGVTTTDLSAASTLLVVTCSCKSLMSCTACSNVLSAVSRSYSNLPIASFTLSVGATAPPADGLEYPVRDTLDPSITGFSVIFCPFTVFSFKAAIASALALPFAPSYAVPVISPIAMGSDTATICSPSQR